MALNIKFVGIGIIYFERRGPLSLTQRDAEFYLLFFYNTKATGKDINPLHPLEDQFVLIKHKFYLKCCPKLDKALH